MSWERYTSNLLDALGGVIVSDRHGEALNVDEGFSRLKALVGSCAEKRQRAYFVGNGASASMACHFSTDLAKMAGVPTEVFTDPSLITATGNDMGYERTFAYPLSQRVVPGELLIAISSSGNSANIVSAIDQVHGLGGHVVTFTAMSPSNAMRSMGDLNFYIPAASYGMAESGHAVLLHHLVDLFSG
jgi:D-sedoheptulose 7-phosphate isomerase